MRKVFPAFMLALVLSLRVAAAGEASRRFFPDILPANAIACLVPPDNAALERDYTSSLFHRLGGLPEMEPFLRSFEESRKELANDLANSSGVSLQFMSELLEAKIGLALINAGIGRGGKPALEFAVVLALRSQPSRAAVFSAVMALLNRPEIVQSILQSQGLDPSLPLKTLAQEESVSGYPPILRIGPDIRVASIDNMVLIYHGQGSEGVTKLFDAAARPAASLSRNPLFQAAWRGAEANPGSSFVYVNIPRLTAILDALNLGGVSRAADALGISRAQALGLSGSYRQDGVRHNLFLCSPGGGMGTEAGLLPSLLPIPAEWKGLGMEAFARTIPASADSFLAMRVDLRALLREMSYLLDSIEAFARPGGLTGMIANERILGVPLAEIVRPLGNEIILRPLDDAQVAIFNNVNIPVFEAVIAQMEHNAGAGFSSLASEGYPIRYFNRRSSLKAPFAPAFFLIPRAQGSQSGILYAASHPQALVSLIRELKLSREWLSSGKDFQKTLSSLSENYSLYYYNGNRDYYRRVYNFLLPLASLWAGSSRYPVDTGLLPVASEVTRDLFGCGLGVKNAPDGALIQVFSPVGANFVPLLLFDRLVVSNPLVIGYLYSRLDNLTAILPTW
ncbi:MAG: hypothetical protein LBU23_04915 [Planctomycetota bacterium]|nr:hypothetical protein [Planctomycetota bacterium]